MNEELDVMQWGAPQADSSPEDERPNAQDLRLYQVAKRGATMEEIAQLKEPKARTPAEAIRTMKLGNARYFNGRTERPELSPVERRAQIVAQTPFAVVLGCSDSCVPVEMIYDQGSGDIFVIRVAGNVVEASTLGSIEYAVRHLKSHVVVVMGHEGCGAVKAAMLDEAARQTEPQNTRSLLDCIAPAVRNLPRIRDDKARMREAVIANVRQQVYRLKQNPVVVEAMDREQVAVIGAYYEISSGAVDFFETEEELRLGN